jgi:hypothetical protein
VRAADGSAAYWPLVDDVLLDGVVIAGCPAGSAGVTACWLDVAALPAAGVVGTAAVLPRLIPRTNPRIAPSNSPTTPTRVATVHVVGWSAKLSDDAGAAAFGAGEAALAVVAVAFGAGDAALGAGVPAFEAGVAVFAAGFRAGLDCGRF